jgi:acetylornithine deacetylase/succinyl-diaminopimelate desuccinylase-like protein
MAQRWSARFLAAAVAFGLVGAAHAQPSQGERERARAIYEHIVDLDTSVEGRQNPAMAAYLSEQFRAAGFPAEDIHVINVENTAGLLVRYRGNGSGGRPILFLAHMDVVPAHRGDWQRDPFTLTEENGFFYGRGTADNKAGVTMLASTFISLRREGFTPSRDLILWFSGDEETTGYTTQALLRDHRALLGEAEFALNADAGGGSLDNTTGVATAYYMQTAEKTYASFTLTVRNPGGHSSVPRADNAIYELSEALLRVRAHVFPVMWNDTTIAAFRAASTVTTGPESQALRRFADRPGDRRAAQTLSRTPGWSTLLRTTCVATLLSAGHADNALPQSATATVNCRIFPGVSIESVRAELQRLAGERVEVALIGEANWSDASPLREDVVAAVTAAVHSHRPGVPITPAMSAGATDGLFFRAQGIPTYGVGEIFIRDQDDFSHGLDERVPVDSFYNGLTHWRTMVVQLAGE